MAMLKRAAAVKPAKTWSPHSQRSIKRQCELEDEIAEFEKLVTYEERRLAEADQSRTRQARLVTTGQPIYTRNLNDSLAEIEQRKGKILTFKETIAGLRKEIESLQLSPSQAAERAGRQAELARLATSRMMDDAGIDAAIEKLLGLLAARAELTARMVKLAGEIDFSGNDFDTARFDALAAALPGAMQLESRRWVKWFLGSEEDGLPCRIRRKFESFPETLAAAHYYRKDEEVLLTKAQREKVEAEDPRPLTTMDVEALYNSPKKPEPEGPGMAHFLIRP